MKTISVHLLAELTGCDRQKLNDMEFVKGALSEAALAAKATILNGYFHQFSPTGISGVLCLAESHISIHTWPEAGYAAVDIFTCGDHAVPQNAITHLTQAFAARDSHVVNLLRGVPDDGGRYISLKTRRPCTQHDIPALRPKTARARKVAQAAK
jgi:S-adenosylmethionine decarboxylase